MSKKSKENEIILNRIIVVIRKTYRVKFSNVPSVYGGVAMVERSEGPAPD